MSPISQNENVKEISKKRVSSRDKKDKQKNERAFEDSSTSVTPIKISVPKDSLKIEMKPQKLS